MIRIPFLVLLLVFRPLDPPSLRILAKRSELVSFLPPLRRCSSVQRPLSLTLREWLYIFLNDPDTGVVSTGIQVPYGCVTNTSSGRPFTYVVRRWSRVFSSKASRASKTNDNRLVLLVTDPCSAVVSSPSGLAEMQYGRLHGFVLVG